MSTTTSPSLSERVAQTDWYHSIEVAPGLVTPGYFDLRPSTSVVPMPASLEGKRCLDIGTWDGFWAFEMEKRGASEVIAIDIDDPEGWDWPPQSKLGERAATRAEYLGSFKNDAAGFRLAREALSSSVERRNQSIYELSPEKVGTFDFAFLGSLLLHLRDPVAALDAVRSVVTGEIVIADTIELFPSIFKPRTPVARLEGLDESWWWMPNRKAVHRMVESAGFAIQETTGIYYVPTGPAHPFPPKRKVFRALLTPRGRETLVVRWRGIPHTAVRAVPIS
jgi:tRNA (mo5U34)-methyltransferase